MKEMNRYQKAIKIFDTVLLLCFASVSLLMLAISFIGGIQALRGDYVTKKDLQKELFNQIGDYDDLEEYLEEALLSDLAEDLEYEFEKIERKIDGINKILLGEFVGINAYSNGRSYYVISVNGEEIETVGDKNYIFVMNETVLVLAIGDFLYSIPIRDLTKGERK